MKKILSITLVLLCLFLALTGCGKDTALDPVITDIDAKASTYKHINNGGVTDDANLPYNIDAITGATLTVEGPGVVTSTPLSVREIESQSEGIVRGLYKDSKGLYMYEGLDLYQLVHNMGAKGDGIVLTDTAYSVVFKNSNREDIATLTVEEIDAAHNAGRPIILAYGIGSKDGSLSAPFVFDGASKSSHSLGYVSKLKNDDGCVKLVYDNKSYGDGKYKTFSNTAYVYICEESTPGFKHSLAPAESFGGPRYVNYVMTFRGDALGREFTFTTKQLENLVKYDSKGGVAKGGIGYKDFYSLANGDNAYWYVNEYEGLKLYELLQYLGMKSAEEMGTKASRLTLVGFNAADGNKSNETFSVDTLSYPEAFGFYKKSSQDMGDGNYVSTNADLVKLGYPVLLCYGVNNYPYTISKTDPAYVSGLSNSGGPFRIVFGKTQYAHENGANQVQQASEIIAGEDILFNTHAYTSNEDHKALASNKIKVSVKNANGQVLIDKDFTIAEIEEAIYGEEVSLQTRKAAKVKSIYELGDSSAVYEGINLKYFFMDVLKLPGMIGNVTFNGDSKTTFTLDRLFATGYNAVGKDSGLPAMLAYAKNGSPLVTSESSKGYEKEVALKPFIDSDPASYTVDNQGGPLMLIIPSIGSDTDSSVSVENVNEISIYLEPDSYAHLDKGMEKYQKSTIRFYGPGLEKERVFTVKEIEEMQTTAKTLDYSILNNAGTLSEIRYRGVLVYDLFKVVGINNNAGDVTIKCSDGSSYTYKLMQLKKSYPNFVDADKDNVSAMIAYGRKNVEESKLGGNPLTADGPLMLIVPQETKDSVNSKLCLKNVVSVYVDANEITSWGHKMSDVYSEFLNYEYTVTFKNDKNEVDFVYTAAQLEEMEDIILRDTYTVLDIGECEGIDLWKLAKRIAGDKLNLEEASAFTVFAEDGFSCDLLAKVGLSGLKDGVANENGDTKKVILAYAQKSFPLVDTENHEGYTGIAKNCDGPLRVVVENAQGASLKLCNHLVISFAGEGELKLK